MVEVQTTALADRQPSETLNAHSHGQDLRFGRELGPQLRNLARVEFHCGQAAPSALLAASSMEDPKSFSAPITAFNQSSTSAGRGTATPYEDARYDVDDENVIVDQRGAVHSYSSSEGVKSETTVGATEDEETLQLQLAAIETKLKLKKLCDQKTAPAADSRLRLHDNNEGPGKGYPQQSIQSSGILDHGHPSKLDDHEDDMFLKEKIDPPNHRIGKDAQSKPETDLRGADLEANITRSSRSSIMKREDNGQVEDANIVDWDGPNDPKNPMNWPAWKVKAHIFLVSAITFIR